MNTMLSALIRFGLFGEESPIAPDALPMDEAEWQRLFDASRKQAVTALLYDAILKLPKELRPSRRVLFHFTSLTQTIEQDNRQREKALVRLTELLHEKLQLPVVVVKGSSLTRHYPEPLHRECGDNDLYTGNDTVRVAVLMETLHVRVEQDSKRHVSFSYQGVEFECHNCLLYHDDDPQWNCEPVFEIGGTTLHALPAWQEAFFLAKHIEYHAVFFHEPVRLRDLVDWSLLTSSPGFDFAALRRLAEGTDVAVFIELLTHYCVDLFGLKGIPQTDICAKKRLSDKDFERIYLHCPERHRWALVRVLRRSGKYLRFGRQYRAIYGQSMFKRFYARNVANAVKQHL